MNPLQLDDTGERILPKILSRQARENGSTAYLVTDNDSISFAEADARSNRLAAGLAALGVGKDDRVAFYMGNRPEMVLLAFAVNKLGALWTPVNIDYKGEWLSDTLKRSRSKVLCTDQQRYPRVAELGAETGIDQVVLLEDGEEMLQPGLVSYAALAVYEPITPDYSEMHYGDSCAILWTSGTTGKSKGVLQSHNCWIRAIAGASKQFDSREGDIIYCPLPLYNTAAWITAIYRALLEGLPCVIEEHFSVTAFMDRIRQFGATQTFVLGAMGVFLWNTPESDDDKDIPLRVAGIAPMPPDIWDAFEQRFGLRILRSGFGMSECQAVMCQLENRDDVPRHSLGFPYPDIEVALCDEEGNAVEPGEVGEICVLPKAPHVLFNGYFDDPENTAKTYRGDWLLTGDMAKQDPATGSYFFVDRKKDAVRFAGRNISTMEVESVVRRHPAVGDVAVFGIPSEEVRQEDELKTDVVLKRGESLTAEALCEFINGAAPHFFVPRYVEFVDSLPYTPTNKVQKFKLREKGVTDHTWDRKASSFVVKR